MAYAAQIIRSLRGNKGFILIPCLILLSLVSFTAIGLLNLTRSDTKTSYEMDQKYKALLNAESAKTIALHALKSDCNFAGQNNITIYDMTGSSDLSVSHAAGFTYDISSTSVYEKAKYALKLKASLYPRAYDFTVSVQNKFNAKVAGVKVLGNLYATGVFRGVSGALVTGDVHLYGVRTVAFSSGDPISVDGKNIPEVQGSVYTDVDKLSPPTWSLADLKAQAEDKGQYYTAKDQIPINTLLKGVVYLDEGVDADFENLTIVGTLVAEGPVDFSTVVKTEADALSTLKIKTGCYLKVISDPTVCEDVAIIAPASYVFVEATGYLDVDGVAVFGCGQMDGTGTITGAAIVGGNLICNDQFVFQSPSQNRDANPDCLTFHEFTVKESERADS